ncbi:MAG: GNAT family N-acetyltransferase [Saprospiraceae bacterium]|nr:GNAT family N-acetyltransferase [Saprospiraceae bacterium]MBP7679915.1 GNAT family N-acetyltransferase [Saprospiraceae bacterium]
MPIHIRPFQSTDTQRIITLFQLNVPKYFALEEEADLQRYLSTSIDLYFVAECAGLIVGCGGINRLQEATVGCLSWDIMHPEWQGKGIGKALVQHRLQVLKSMSGIKKIMVRTAQFTYPFYEKCGFRVVEIVKDYWATGYDLYAMEYSVP